MKKGPGSSTNTPALFIGWEQSLICGGRPGLQPKKALGEHVIKSGCLLATDRQDIFHRHHDSIIAGFFSQKNVWGDLVGVAYIEWNCQQIGKPLA